MPDASKIAATIVARLGLSERFRLTTAHITKTRLNIGIEYTTNINPIIEVAIDLSMICEVTTRAIIIRTTEVHRSNRGALLKKTHQITTANPRRIPPNIPAAIAPGTKIRYNKSEQPLKYYNDHTRP